MNSETPVFLDQENTAYPELLQIPLYPDGNMLRLYRELKHRQNNPEYLGVET